MTSNLDPPLHLSLWKRIVLRWSKFLRAFVIKPEWVIMAVVMMIAFGAGATHLKYFRDHPISKNPTMVLLLPIYIGGLYFIAVVLIFEHFAKHVLMLIQRFQIPRYVDESIEAELKELSLSDKEDKEQGGLQPILKLIAERYAETKGEGEQYIDAALAHKIKAKDILAFAESNPGPEMEKMKQYVSRSFYLDVSKYLSFLIILIVLLRTSIYFWEPLKDKMLWMMSVEAWKRYWPGAVFLLVIYNQVSIKDLVERFLPKKK